MSLILRQSTERKVRVGPFVDATDGKTPETGITLGAADQAELLKADGAATVDISGATWAAVTGCDGWYDLTLSTSHTDTVGELVVVVQDVSDCLPVHKTFQVVEEAIYDALYASGVSALNVNTASLSANAITAASITDGSITAAKIATNAITDAKIATAAITQNKVSTGVTVSVLGSSLRTEMGMASANLDTQLAAIVADTNELQTDWANGGRLDLILDELTTQGDTNEAAVAALNDLSQADIRTAVGLAAANLDTQLGGLLTLANDTNTDTMDLLADVADIQGIGFSSGTHSLVKVFSAIDTLNDLDSTAVEAAATAALNAYDPPTKAELDTAESNIRGVDSDTLKSLSDQIDGISAGSSPQVLQNTTIATLASQTQFTLTAGSADDDAYNGAVAVITDQATSTQKAFVPVVDYVGSTKTLTLLNAPAFTIAVGDTIDLIAGTTARVTSMADDVITSDACVDGFMTADKIAANAITDAKISTAAITQNKVSTGVTVSVLGSSIRTELGMADADLDDQFATVSTNISTAESNIRGADSDTLKTLSDQIDGIAAGSSPQLLQNTTIATLASQTEFTLTAGSADDDAYNGAIVVVTDQSTSTQKAFVPISDYVGSTKTVTLTAGPAFTIAIGDTVDIIASASDAPTAAAIRAEIDSNSTQLAAIVADTNELQTDWANGGRLDNILDAVLVDTNELQTDWTNNGRLDLILDELTTQGDTNEAAIAALNDLDSTAVQAAATAALTAYDPPTNTEMLASFSALNDLSAAEVNAEVDTALADYDGPTNTEMVAAFTEIKGATWASTDTLEEIRDNLGGGGGGDATAANQTTIINHLTDIKGATWSSSDTLEGIFDAVGGLNDLDATAVQAAAAAALNAYDPPTQTEMTAAFTEIKGPTWSSSTDTLEEISDAAGSGGGAEVTVVDFSQSALNKLAGIEVNLRRPVWTSQGFSCPIVRGDSYTGDFALEVTVSGWTGTDLSTASRIRLSGVGRRDNTGSFSWDGTYEAGTPEKLVFDLSSSDTNVDVGEYSIDVEVQWASGEVVTVHGPGIPLTVVQDQTTS